MEHYEKEEPVKDLLVFKISGLWQRELTRNELGRLTADFNKKFHFWSLLVRTYLDNNHKGCYALYIIRGVGVMAEDEKISAEEFDKMKSFISGYSIAVRSFVEKKSW